MAGKILVVDDEANHRLMIKLHLHDSGYKTEEAANGALALIKLDEFQPDLILLDMKMDVMDGMTLLEHLKRRSIEIPVIIITAFSSIKTAVEAMKLGAVDYLTKPVDIDLMLETISKTFREAALVPPQKFENDYIFDGVYSPDGFGKVIEQLRMIAPTDKPVLIIGESGTGKDLTARSIHENSPRKNRAFITVNCAALTSNALESELFGHMKGAFSGASVNKEGAFELAGAGTVYLDEINETSPDIQAKLLRILEEKKYEKAGGIRSVVTEARIIASASKDLKEHSENGGFRGDLFFRLSALTVNISPLRERMQEIEALINFFISKYAVKFGKLIKGADTSYVEKLKRYCFYGNVRELENIIERSIILSKTEKLKEDTLPPLDSKNCGVSLDIKDNEKELILKALEQTGGNKTKAAQVLGISRRTLHSKINEFGIK